MELRILFEDETVLAVEKPPGLLSVPGRGPDKADCVVTRASAGRDWVREVHRLDQATSGILLLARTPSAHRNLSDAFARRLVEKTYIATCVGLPRDPGRPEVEFSAPDGGGAASAGRIGLYQRLDIENRPRQVVVEPDAPGSRYAVTHWKLAVNQMNPGTGETNRLILSPETGRTHQLRLALAVCAAAIAGDRLYGNPEDLSGVRRLMLHAMNLRFPHPVTGRTIEIVSDPEF